MARPSKLTRDQWLDVERRLLNGEQASALAREYKVSPSQITRNVTRFSQKLRNVAHSLAKAHNELAELPPAQQYTAISLAEKLRSISSSLASAAELGAKTAHRLHSLANSEINKVDDADPLNSQSIEALKGVSALTKLANDSSQIAVSMLSANKATAFDIDDKPIATLDVTKLSSAARRELLAAKDAAD